MDQAVLQLLARIKIRLRHDKGIILNTQRFFSDLAYAGQVLDTAEESEDVELVTASLEIRNRLGWISIQAPHAGTTTTPNTSANKQPQSSAPKADSGRYVFGARS